ncbi:phosphopentomutase [Aminicella lysinilytica]|uniref:Phosphopentomutase n=1 Tax=Aminicella lysinilytica TaxID=433323 RepID=A0A4R6Q7A5_9FIRM|nr:phosphopentomutase [Aminicella lysinilytica]TDP58404.1 phosphopentomutase [Aminicella lysinilytica]
MKRVILMVMDSMGVGAEPDADKYGDLGADTLLHAAENTDNFAIPNLQKLGLGNIQGAGGGRFVFAPEKLTGSYGRMQEMSRGKDTITGHWEIAGIETMTPFKTYPDGFPAEFIEEFQRDIGSEVIGNYAASGTVIIEDLGDEHEATGKPIVYTSADSVFQIAANTDVIPLERLYEICKIARKLLVGKWACGRVIARPYVKKDGKRVRTTDRRDYAVSPPEPTVLDHISGAGQTVYAIGKISDIFNGQGVTKSVHTTGNMDGVDQTISAMGQDFGGFIFTNLVDFDSLYGHRRDPSGYGHAIMDYDSRLPEIIGAMKDEDILMITADHGNDPVHSGFDHTREYVPLMIYGKNIRAGVDIGTRHTFADCGQTIADYLGVYETRMGESFLGGLLK